jgi:hypothetical protein
VLPGLELTGAPAEPGVYSGSVQLHHYRIEKREISFTTSARLDAKLELAADGRAHFTLRGNTEETYRASEYAHGGAKRDEKREKFELALTGALQPSGELALHDGEHAMVLQLRCRPGRFVGRSVLACVLENAPHALFGLGVDRDRGDAGWLLLATDGIDVRSDRDQRDPEPKLSLVPRAAR